MSVNIDSNRFPVFIQVYIEIRVDFFRFKRWTI
ncbi:hypothetical protein LSS_21460 [Leptospira santarosai serovar Shermani str. LT 821]|uniref:Uncharacterized protein n=1 Tax=Leptospira santarosai serovar Shermani str. LT 821 TaxID=758847 RepID=A0A097ESH0_9LEPT|nr:hypothetical protein LSS_21460 [Leptospira santarosai serovar Shermani str. LT 821]